MDYSPFNYYGFDYLAALCAIVGMFFLGEKKRVGFVLYMVATTSGLVFSILAQSPPLMVTNILMFIMNLRGYIRWKQI